MLFPPPSFNGIVVYVQGSAVFWYNLLHDGQGNEETQHAACPVLVGSKWGEFGQDSHHLVPQKT